MKYFVSKTDNRYDAPLDGINVFEVDIVRQFGQPITAIIKKILVGGLKNPDTKKMSTSWEKILNTKKQVIKRIFEL